MKKKVIGTHLYFPQSRDTDKGLNNSSGGKINKVIAKRLSIRQAQVPLAKDIGGHVITRSESMYILYATVEDIHNLAVDKQFSLVTEKVWDTCKREYDEPTW